MKIGHSRPNGVTWTVDTTAGAAILSAAANLDDNRPDTTTAIRWTGGTQNTGSVVRLRGAWATPQSVGLLGLSNLRLPAGTRISASLRRATDPAGTYPYAPPMLASSQRLFSGIRDERTAWLLLSAEVSNIVGVEFQIWNDVNGVASIPASFVSQLGEAVVASAIDVPVAPGAQITPVDPTVKRRPNGQPYVVPDIPYRRLSCKFNTGLEAAYFGSTGTDYESLIARLDRGQTGIFILRYRTKDGVFSPQLLHRYAMIGIASALPAISQAEGRIASSGDLVVDESPIPP